MSKDFNEAVDVLFHKVDDLVSTKTVVGDAIVVGDMTLLPLIDVAVGAGVGAKESANAAGGMGARITPSAILMIRPDGVQLINVKNQDAVTKVLDMVPDFVNKFTSGKKSDPEVDKAVNDILDGEKLAESGKIKKYVKMQNFACQDEIFLIE